MSAGPEPAEEPKGRHPKPSRPAGVFISYRREDASGFAGRLHGSLTDHFGPNRVFRDVNTIQPGADFHQAISAGLGACGAFVVVIGREWVVDLKGRRRLDDPTDWVRVELEAVLQRSDVLVIPVLVENAALPAAADLPPSLVPLLSRNAVEVSDTRWEFDVRRLTDSLEAVVGPPATTWPARIRRAVVPRSPVGAIVRIVVAVAVVVGMIAVLPSSPSTPRIGPMSGDFNIAVADFESVDATGRPVDSVEADTLAQSVHDLLQERLASISRENFDLKLRAPGETGPIRGATREAGGGGGSHGQTDPGRRHRVRHPAHRHPQPVRGRVLPG